MQMTIEARSWLDAAVRRILARYMLGDAERAGITYELMSHLHSAGEARASAAGRTEVTRQDLELALLEAGGDDALAAAFVQPLAKPVQRVLFARRLGAFLVDGFLLGIMLLATHGFLPTLLDPILGGLGGPPLTVRYAGWAGPFLYHEPVAGLAVQAIIALVTAAVIVAFYALSEGRDGRSPGKRALDLRVMREDGAPLTPRDAIVRNLVKLAPILLVVDTLIMLVAFGDAKQRLSDRVAKTIVVRA